MSPATTASATIANPQNFKMRYDGGRRDGRAFADHRSCHGGRMEVDFSRVIDALPGLVWTALPDGYIDFVNQRWCEYTGLSHENAYGLGWQTAICLKICQDCSNAGDRCWLRGSPVKSRRA